MIGDRLAAFDQDFRKNDQQRATLISFLLQRGYSARRAIYKTARGEKDRF